MDVLMNLLLQNKYLTMLLQEALSIELSILRDKRRKKRGPLKPYLVPQYLNATHLGGNLNATHLGDSRRLSRR